MTHDELRARCEQLKIEVKGLQTQLATATRIMNEMGQQLAKEVRFTNAEFEAWQSKWATQLATAKLGEGK